MDTLENIIGFDNYKINVLLTRNKEELECLGFLNENGFFIKPFDRNFKFIKIRFNEDSFYNDIFLTDCKIKNSNSILGFINRIFVFFNNAKILNSDLDNKFEVNFHLKNKDYDLGLNYRDNYIFEIRISMNENR